MAHTEPDINQKRSLHLVSHTHWDREWYLPFQLFRLKLIALVDSLLDLLAKDPDYRHFTLDGQTIILDDYLYMRPENEETIRKYVQNGRLLIGPWYILPDEFLVSPEATVRNLLQGDRSANRFGSKMNIGYIPDPFGHIGQLPQILNGFGIESACLQRGLADEPCEFWWQAPDGSRVLLANLRDGYMNAMRLPTSQPDSFVSEIDRLRDSLLPHTVTSHLLLMHGNDHMPPVSNTSQAIARANHQLEEDHILHSSLPQYIQSIQSQITERRLSLPVVQGELRSCKRHHLLPGVYSTRIWIKQRNHSCETSLEKWAEPFSTWASLVKSSNAESVPAAILHRAWRLLMECHPHDSICGCSIDQVHREMRPRFDQVEQIAEEIARQSLTDLTGSIDTTSPSGQNNSDFLSIVVFNPTASPQTNLLTVEVELPEDVVDFELVNSKQEKIPFKTLGSGRRELVNLSLDRELIFSTLHLVQDGKAAGFAIQDVAFHKVGSQLKINVVLSETMEPNLTVWRRAQEELRGYLANADIEKFTISARTPASTRLALLAQDIPPYGYSTIWARSRTSTSSDYARSVKMHWWLRPLMPIANSLSQLPLLKDRFASSLKLAIKDEVSTKPPYEIENQHLKVEASPQDGTLRIHDKRTGAVYSGLNRFVDGGDSGDEYNYNPPNLDNLITHSKVQKIGVFRDQFQPSMKIYLNLRLPKRLNQDRQSRSVEKADLSIISRVSLTDSVPRIDIQTKVDNGDPPIKDHRLRVHFPAPFSTSYASYDGHYEVIDRDLEIPNYDSDWVEQPRPEKPQRAFVSLTDGRIGQTIANRGLPEVEVFSNPKGNAEIALTLLRCVGWLSRDDLSTRKGHAGPMIATPEAQMPGTYTFNYAIIPHKGNWQNSFQQAYAFNSPLKGETTDLHTGVLPSASSFIDVDSPSFVITAVKSTENGSGWIVRGYNLLSEQIDFKITSFFPIKQAFKINLAEEIQHALPVENQNSVKVSARGHEIITLKFQNT